MSEAAASEHTIADRLNRLFAETVDADGRPYSLRDVADGVNRTAGERLLSATYLSQLRLGQRTNPGHRRLRAIADFFGVDVHYFDDAAMAQRTDEELELLGSMRNPVVRDIALRAQGLSESALQAVRALMDHYRSDQGLPPTGDPPA